jgi:hypothetical protein
MAANQKNCKTMNGMSITKTTAAEQIQNSRLMTYFVHAFVANNVDALKGMLHDEGVFMGKYSKVKMAGVFYNIFFGSEKGIQMLFNVHINHGVALNKISGAEVVEIRFCDEDVPVAKFGEPANTKKGERVFRFCFRFKEGKIIDIQCPTRFVESTDELTANN